MTEGRHVVFVVDDDSIQRKVMLAFLAGLPLDIRTYQDPEEAWHDLSVHRPRIVLLDLIMPKLGGEAWMVRLSEERKMNDFHLVVVTAGNVDEETEFGLFSMGAMEVLRKPVDRQALRSLVMELVKEAP